MPPKKGGGKKGGKVNGPKGMSKPLPSGLVLKDLTKKEWKLGPVIGQGGFGYIYLGSKSTGGNVTLENAENVVKVEPHDNGPLFVELAFYHRVAKPEMISTWMKTQEKKHLGVPVYVGSGSFENDGAKYRFMVMDRYGTDVEKIYKNNEFHFPEKTVFSLALRILDALEYIHEKEYVHADIKSSNLMMGHNKDKNKVYLLDYGLAYRYLPNGTHVPYKEDPKRRHDGTIEYTSRDAHLGCAPSRRGDLEILGYCMVQWLCRKLPWENKLTDQEYVMKEKIKYMGNIKGFMKTCFPDSSYPAQLEQYLQLVVDMEYNEKPNYKKIQSLLVAALKASGGKDDGVSVLLPTTSTPNRRQKRRSNQEDHEEDLKSPPKKARTNKETVAKNSPRKVTPTKRRGEPVSSLKPASVISSRKVASPQKVVAPKSVVSTRKAATSKTRVSPRSKLKTENNLNGHEKRVMNGHEAKVVHMRYRQKNVQMRDFAQSP